MSGPNPLRVAWKSLSALRVGRPNPQGTTDIDHTGFGPVLDQLANDGLGSVDRVALAAYASSLLEADPDELSRDGALAYWVNLYNAHAIDLACDAFSEGADSVLDIRASFDRPVADVAGERLSLMDVEHGKIRRFRDPRIHGALVCGSLSCPTLRPAPFTGDDIGAQLDQQMRTFLERGGVQVTEQTVFLSRVFLWYGADFVRPYRMPLALPASRRAVARAVTPWMAPGAVELVESGAPILFQSYDWGLACTVA